MKQTPNDVFGVLIFRCKNAELDTQTVYAEIDVKLEGVLRC